MLHHWSKERYDLLEKSLQMNRIISINKNNIKLGVDYICITSFGTVGMYMKLFSIVKIKLYDLGGKILTDIIM